MMLLKISEMNWTRTKRVCIEFMWVTSHVVTIGNNIVGEIVLLLWLEQSFTEQSLINHIRASLHKDRQFIRIC